MRLTQYITESKEQDISKFIKNVKKDCKPWLSAIKNCTNKVIYRGYVGKFIDKKNVRTDRKPKDMPPALHKELDSIFYEKFGWKPRSEGLFVSPHIYVGATYGNSGGVCFPTGKFKFVWNPDVHDLFAMIQRHHDGESTVGDYILEGYRDKDICRALSTMTEIMIKCKSYHIIDYSYLTSFEKNTRDSEWTKGLLIKEIIKEWIDRSFF